MKLTGVIINSVRHSIKESVNKPTRQSILEKKIYEQEKLKVIQEIEEAQTMDINEKLTDPQKVGIQRALGSKHPSNLTRKTSTPARELIGLVKKHGKDHDKFVKEEMDHMTMPMKDLNKHIDHIEKQHSGDEPVSSSDRAYLKKIKDIRFKRMKMQKEEVEQVDENVQAAKQVIKRYGNDVRKSHIRSHAKEIGMDPAKLSSAVSKLTGKPINEDTEYLDEALKSSDPVAKWIHDFVHSDNPKFDGKSEAERRKMALGAYYAAQKKESVDEYENPTEELAEGRGRPPKEGSKAWHAAKAKSTSGEGDDSQEADKNIRTQLQKVVSVGKHVTFNNGESKKIEPNHAHKALALLDNTPKPSDKEAIQKSLSHSHDRFHATIKSGKPVTDSARPKVSLGKMRMEDTETRGKLSVATYRDKDGVLKLKNTKKGTVEAPITVEDTELLNKLYNNLSEENKVLFEEKMLTNEGVVDLINFAIDQGF